MKRIWIVNYQSEPPQYVSNPRHLEFAKHLMGIGYDVIIICSGFLGDKNIDLLHNCLKYKKVKYGEYKFFLIKVKNFSSNGWAKMFSIFQFAFKLYKYRKEIEKPDIILHNIHAPFDYPVSFCAKNLKAKYIVETWDLWPEGFVRFGLIGENNPITKLAYCVEKKLYEKADKIIFTFEGGIDYLKQKKWTQEYGGKIDLKKVFYINNGVNVSEFNTNKERYQISDEDLEDNEHFKVIYLGSIRLANNLKELIDAAAILIDNPRYKFMIYGDGYERGYLENYCIENNITNVIFKARWTPFSYVPYILSRSSLNILNYKNGFGEYGASSGKLFQYLACGKPICCNIGIAYCLINKYNLGIAKRFANSKDYANAIIAIGNMDELSYNAMCGRVRNVAGQFDFKVLFNKLDRVIGF